MGGGVVGRWSNSNPDFFSLLQCEQEKLGDQSGGGGATLILDRLEGSLGFKKTGRDIKMPLGRLSTLPTQTKTSNIFELAELSKTKELCDIPALLRRMRRGHSRLIQTDCCTS